MSALTRWGFDRKAGGPKRPVPLVRSCGEIRRQSEHRRYMRRTREAVNAAERLLQGQFNRAYDGWEKDAEKLASWAQDRQATLLKPFQNAPKTGAVEVVSPKAKKEAKPRIKSGATVKEYQAKAGGETQGGRMLEPCVEPVSRPAAGRAAAATSEFMDVTAGETATELPERLDGFASVQDGLCQMSTNGALPAGTETPAARTPALRGVTAGETAPVSDPVEATPPKQVSAPVADMAALPLVAPTQPPPARAPISTRGEGGRGQSVPPLTQQGAATTRQPEKVATGNVARQQVSPEPTAALTGRALKTSEPDRAEMVRKAPAPLDWCRVADAAKSRKVAPPAPKPRPTRVALSREACSRCGVPGWRGCDHQLPFEDTP